MDPTTLLAGGGIVGLFVAATALILALLRIWSRMVRSSFDREQVLAQRVDHAVADAASARHEAWEANRRAAALQRDHQSCQDDLATVKGILVAHGIEWPSD